MLFIRKLVLPVTVGAIIAIASNSVALEIIFQSLKTDHILSGDINDYIGRVTVSILLTLWISVMVALYIERRQQKQAEERNAQEKQLLYINRETELRNAPWLDYTLKLKKDPLTDTTVDIQALHIYVVLWWQKIVHYLDANEKTSLIEFIKNEYFLNRSQKDNLGYLGNGVFYKYQTATDDVSHTEEYVEYAWNNMAIAISHTSVSCAKSYNSYQLVTLGHMLAKKVEEGADYFENLGTVAKSKSAVVPEAWEAIKSGNVDFAFQPIFDLCSAEVKGFEMLARLRAQDGSILPVTDEVAEIFENSPLSLRFNKLLLGRLLDFQHKLNSISIGKVISINVPAPILIRPAMLKEIYICVEQGLKLNQVAFELTERTLPARSKAVKEGLYRLIGLGARIHLDDFGAGQSSIETISAYDFDLIKLDRYFILSDTWTEEKAHALVTYLKSLGAEVLVEGIEDESLSDLFANVGAQYVQGYAFARPMSEEAALKFAKTNSSA